MNRFLSIIELKSRQYLGKVALTLLVCAAAEFAAFALKLKIDADWNLYKMGMTYTFCFAIMLTGITIYLGGTKFDKSNSLLRLRLLKTSPWVIYLAEFLFSLICLLLVWAVQAAVVVISAKIYTSSAGYAFGPQGPLLQIDSLLGLHAIVPLGHIRFWIGTALCVLALALASAYMRYSNRRKNFPLTSWLVIVIVFGFLLYLGMRVDGFYSEEALGAPITAMIVAVITVLFARMDLRKVQEEADDGE